MSRLTNDVSTSLGQQFNPAEVNESIFLLVHIISYILIIELCLEHEIKV